MLSDLKDLFPHCVQIDKGAVCEATPFSGVFPIDYYDGAIEGFCQIKETGNILYFKKIWWDKFQDNRLFDGFIISTEELEKNNPGIRDFISELTESRKWTDPLHEKERSLLSDVAKFIVNASSSVHVNIFCRNIYKSLFILPIDKD